MRGQKESAEDDPYLAEIHELREKVRTGELTLSGRVLPVGGIKEKILAARSAGVKTVILPKKNEENLDDIPDYIKGEMNLVLVEHIQEVLDLTQLS